MHIPFFRIFYSTTFTLLSLLLAALLLITPADQIRQAFLHRKVYNVFIVAGAYLLTLLIAIFLYASRLFNNRSVLASIPRPWSPVENGDVKKRVRRLIAEGLKNSAVIAYQARPRDLSNEQRPEEASTHGAGDHLPAANPAPVWGIISHPGWSSPSSPDLPNLHYDPVIHELAHLIEAKAVSLAPAASMPIMSTESEAQAPPSDPLAVELLQRPATMGLRDYIWHLSSLGMIHPSNLGDDFLSIYEKARFSNRPLDEVEFRALMRIFAAILRGMTTLNPDTIPDELRAEQASTSDISTSPLSDTNRTSLDSSATVEYTPQPHLASFSPKRSPNLSAKSRSRSWNSARTAASRKNSLRSHNPSLTSLRLRPVQSTGTASSARSYESSGSVIRLAEARGPLDLPYVFLDASGQPI